LPDNNKQLFNSYMFNGNLYTVDRQPPDHGHQEWELTTYTPFIFY
jgi:hypothetical protein